MKCPNCHEEIKSSLASKCPHCGFPLTEDIYHENKNDKFDDNPNLSQVDPDDVPDFGLALFALLLPPLGLAISFVKGSKKSLRRKVYLIATGAGLLLYLAAYYIYTLQ